MIRTTPLRIAAWTTAGALLAGSLLFVEEDAFARRRRQRRVGEITEIFPTYGVQGRAGAGSQVQLAFRLVDAKMRLHTLDTEYGWDVNGDGAIADDEFFPATTNTRDPRATIRRLRLRNGKFAERYSSAPGRGAVHAVVWDSTADVGYGSFLLETPLFDDAGREVRDPFTGAPVTERGPGVVLRIRPRSGKGRIRRGEWSYSEPFDLDNRVAPQLVPGTVTPGPVTALEFTAIASDSEDANGNGVLDAGEDANDDGVLGTRRVRVVMDWYRLAAGEDPQSYSAEELAALHWQPCAVAGDPAELDADPIGAPGTVRWAAAAQIPAGVAQYVLRVRAVTIAPFDQAGDWEYVLAPFTLAP